MIIRIPILHSFYARPQLFPYCPQVQDNCLRTCLRHFYLMFLCTLAEEARRLLAPLHSRCRMITRHLVLAASVVMGAVYAIHTLDPATLPLAGATAGNPSSMVPALVADSANPYRWADLAEACAHAGQMDRARYAFQRALALSRDIPPILLRDANFHF